MSQDVYSMTGFGAAEALSGDRLIGAEARSVNQRFLDVRTRLPREISSWETEFALLLKKKFTRGKVEFFVKVERARGAASVHCDFELAEAYTNALKDLKQRLGLAGEVGIEQIASFSDVFSAPPDSEAMARLKEDCRAALESAAENLIEMRRVEGDNLRTDMLERADALDAFRAKIEEIAPARMEKYRAALHKRLDDLMRDGLALDPGRVEQEAVIYSDRSDVTEELVRLESHLEVWRETLRNGGAIGRKLDFLTQEIHREVNTIGSKSLDSEITSAVVEMKIEVEKMREQAQNIE